MIEPRDERLQIMLSVDELKVVDDFRFKQRMPSRAAAVRELMKRGLAAEGYSVATLLTKSADYGVTGGELILRTAGARRASRPPRRPAKDHTCSRHSHHHPVRPRFTAAKTSGTADRAPPPPSPRRNKCPQGQVRNLAACGRLDGPSAKTHRHTSHRQRRLPECESGTGASRNRRTARSRRWRIMKLATRPCAPSIAASNNKAGPEKPSPDTTATADIFAVELTTGL